MLTKPNDVTPTPRRVLLLGATGTIGRATARALIARGYEVVCIVRASVSDLSDQSRIFRGKDLSGVELRYGQVASAGSLNSLIRREDGFDAIVSCLASRTGAPKDAWAIDFQAHADVLAVAKDVGISHIVLLSAICVQKPRLEFQKAKLAFEKLLMNSGVTYSIVRPTAYFKSLSGQIERVRQGKPFLLFGSGELTSCKPISNMDLATFIVDCLSEPDMQNEILPVGGPGKAITPREQGGFLFELLDRPAKFRRVPVGAIQVISSALTALAHVVPTLADKAEFARIAHYYATESMLVWDPEKAAYSPDGTPSYGLDTLKDHYRRVIEQDESVSLGDHAMF